MSQIYFPAQGDIIKMNFDPQAGHEQNGYRPAVVVSNDQYNRHCRPMVWVCPITNTLNGFPMHVELDDRTRITGAVECEHTCSRDLSARNARFVEKLPHDLLEAVLKRLHASL